MRRGAIACAAVLGALLTVDGASAGYTLLQIIINGSNPKPRRPSAPINTLQELSAAFADCWNPPPVDPERQPIDLTFQVSFKRSGELFGKPRAVQFARTVSQEERERY